MWQDPAVRRLINATADELYTGILQAAKTPLMQTGYMLAVLDWVQFTYERLGLDEDDLKALEGRVFLGIGREGE